MELANEEYGDKKIIVYIYKDVTNKSVVNEIISKYPNNLAVCNATLILSLKHLLLALNRAVYNYNYYKMKTDKLSTEIIYHLSPHNSVVLISKNR